MKTTFAAVALLPVSVLAQSPAAPTPAAGTAAATLPPVVVTATRVETPPFDVPASIDRIDGETIRDNKLQVNLSENVGGVPGLLARDRQNYAQDVQVSVRGFGARSTFGIRGVRVVVDGIPATLPDGQGQLTHIDLGSAERIEVLRGPFSALYGNSSGGVIDVVTEEGRGAPTVTLGAAGGSYDTVRASAKVTGGSPSFGYVADVSRFETDGYRDHSAARRDIANIKLTARPDPAGKLTVVLNHMDLPKAQDPLGLTRAQWRADPRSVDPVALQFDTRKTVRQTQLGATYERDFGGIGALRLMAYGGERETVQFQAIPTGTQLGASVAAGQRHPGGVIDLGREYRGGDLRWTFKGGGAGQPYTLVAGLAYDELDEDRRGFRNFVGQCGEPAVPADPCIRGVRGEPRRDERNKATSSDQYVQGSWKFTPRWRLDAGVRHTTVKFRSRDNFILGANPDDSGSARYSETLPVAGLMFSATEQVNVYAAVGRGFETPTLNEISYRPDGTTGLNFALRPARSDNVEVGVKTRYESVGMLNLALFVTSTDDEIATLTNSGGRAVFQNVGSSRRRGLELSWSRPVWGDLRAQAAYTWLDAKYRDTFTSCITTGCPTAPGAAPVTVPAGNRIPGLARHAVYAALGWLPESGWRAGVEARALSKVFTSDPNSEAAPGFATAGAHVGYAARWGRWDWRAFARVDNLFDRDYIGSVIVNEGNGRFYEPAPGRNTIVGVSGAYAF